MRLAFGILREAFCHPGPPWRPAIGFPRYDLFPSFVDDRFAEYTRAYMTREAQPGIKELGRLACQRITRREKWDPAITGLLAIHFQFRLQGLASAMPKYSVRA